MFSPPLFIDFQQFSQEVHLATGLGIGFAMHASSKKMEREWGQIVCLSTVEVLLMSGGWGGGAAEDLIGSI